MLILHIERVIHLLLVTRYFNDNNEHRLNRKRLTLQTRLGCIIHKSLNSNFASIPKVSTFFYINIYFRYFDCCIHLCVCFTENQLCLYGMLIVLFWERVRDEGGLQWRCLTHVSILSFFWFVPTENNTNKAYVHMLT